MKTLKDIGTTTYFSTDCGPLPEDGVEYSVAGNRYRIVLRPVSEDGNEIWCDIFQRVKNDWEVISGVSLLVDEQEPKRLAANRKARGTA